MAKRSVSFSTGLETIDICGDPARAIRFNPRDLSIPQKLRELLDETKRVGDSLRDVKDEEEASRFLVDADARFCEMVDRIFGKNTAVKLFEGVNCLSFAYDVDENGGEVAKPLLCLAIEKLMPVITEGMEAVLKKEAAQRHRMNAQFLK